MDIVKAQKCWQDMLAVFVKTYGSILSQQYFEPLKVYHCDMDNLIFVAPQRNIVNKIRMDYINQFYNNAPIYFGINFNVVDVMTQDEAEAFLRKLKASKLNDRYTFDSFVIGQSNMLAYSASKAVAEHPGEGYNPLFLYAESGLGKTHLMTAIANDMMKRDSSTNVGFYSADQFTEEVVNAIRTKSTNEMKERMRGYDILFIDDIQMLANRQQTQEEFFNAFNELYSKGKQIVISADQPPEELKVLEERMRTRFQMGIVMCIDRPDFETRVAILKNKAIVDRISVTDEACEYIAQNVNNSIRELEGALNNAAFYARNMAGFDGTVTREVCEATIRVNPAAAPKGNGRIDATDIIRAVCGYYPVSREDILSKKRNKEITVPRQLAMFLCKELCMMSTTRIGREFGRDHSTVMNSFDRAEEMLQSDKEFRAVYDAIKITLK